MAATNAPPGADEAYPRAQLATLYAAFFLLLGAAMTARVHGNSLNVYATQAAAFLHGRFDVAADLHDVAVVAGRGYFPLGAAPSVLLIPVVAVFGAGVPDVVVGVGALVVATLGMYRLVTAELAATSQRAWWVLGAVAGTPLLACAFNDNAYYAAHVVVVACLAWAMVLALSGRSPVLAGLLVGLAAATRLDAAAGIVPVAAMYARAHSHGSRLARPAIAAAGVLPFLLLVAWYNAARFGNPLESGYGLQNLNYPWLAALRAQGLFSVRHLPENLYYLLVAGPVFTNGGHGLPRSFPWIVPSEWGMGLAWTSPWLFVGVLARGRRVAIVAAGALLVLLPSLFYYGVGWIQFGYRYGLDALPFLLLLAAWGQARVPKSRRLVVVLLVWSLVVNAWGILWLMGMWGVPRAYTG